MKILALEFSSARRGVAVVEAVPAASSRRPDAASAADGDWKSPALDARVLGLAEGDGLSPGPFELIEAALRESGVEREDITVIAVGLGPGSYAGIRSAIALAQGWQLASGVRTLGISSVDALVATAQERGIAGRVACVIDAQRGEFYTATHELSPGESRCVARLRIVSRAAVDSLARDGFRLIGPEVAGLNLPDACELFPSAAMLGRLAGERTDFQPGEKLEPIYLRETSFVKAPPPRVH